LRDYLIGDAARVAWLLLGAVAGLLLIACVNVANLILARLAARNRELCHCGIIWLATPRAWLGCCWAPSPGCC